MQTVAMRSILVACLVSVAAVIPTAAQERAWFFSATSSTYTGPSVPPGLFEVNIGDDGLGWSAGRRVVLPTHYLTAGPVFFGGGRYIVWAAEATSSGSESVVVRFDTRSGATSILPLRLQSTVALTVDPRSGRLVIADAAGIHFVDSGDRPTVTTWLIPHQEFGSRWIAAGGDRLFLGRDAAVNAYMLILDASTGSLLRVIPDVFEGQVSRDERRFYATRPTRTGYDVDTWDIQTVTPVAHGTLPGPAAGAPKLVDELLFTFWGVGQSDVYLKLSHAMTSETVAEATVRSVGSGPHADLIHASSSGLFYLQVRGWKVYGSNQQIIAFDRDTGRSHSISTAPLRLPTPSTLLILAPPDPPVRIRARMSGRTVTLEWDAPANVGDYEITAGSAPGLHDIAVFRSGGAASLTVPDVPAGAYYVRVRAINELGSSESDEVLVIVR